MLDGSFSSLSESLLVLLTSPSTTSWASGLRSPAFQDALLLSMWTSVSSVAIAAVLGTPLAWWLSRATSLWRHVVEVVVELPIVIPPAVVGVALLTTFGAQGFMGTWLSSVGVFIPFSTAAVIFAQVTVATPFFIQAAANAFRKVSDDDLDVAMTLGATPGEALLRVALPSTLPGLVVGLSLAWARALGEFGATLMFAGNLSGKTQTLTLAIYTTFESDLRAAQSISVVLVVVAFLLLFFLTSRADAKQRNLMEREG